jgi:hypothetical protein
MCAELLDTDAEIQYFVKIKKVGRYDFKVRCTVIGGYSELGNYAGPFNSNLDPQE